MLGGGSPNGTSASETANLRLGLRRAVTRTYAHRALVVAGRLLDGQGQPIGHATSRSSAAGRRDGDVAAPDPHQDGL